MIDYKISETGNAKSRLGEKTITITGDTSFTVQDSDNRSKNYIVTPLNQYRPIYINGKRYSLIYLLAHKSIPNPENLPYLINPSLTNINKYAMYWSKNRPARLIQVEQASGPTKIYGSVSDVADILDIPKPYISLRLKDHNGIIPQKLVKLTELGSLASKNQTKKRNTFPVQITNLNTEQTYQAPTIKELATVTNLPITVLRYQLVAKSLYVKSIPGWSKPEYVL
jgi:hypothetical protein